METWPTYGECKYCAGARENPTPSTGDAPYRRTDPIDLPLVRYHGKLMCERCKRRKIHQVQSKKRSIKEKIEIRFKARVGYRTTIS